MRRINRWLVEYLYKGPVMQTACTFHAVILWLLTKYQDQLAHAKISQYSIDIASLYATTKGFYGKRIGMEMIASSFLYLWDSEVSIQRYLQGKTNPSIKKTLMGWRPPYLSGAYFYWTTVTRYALGYIIHIIHALVDAYVLMPIWGQNICNHNDNAGRFRNTQRNA